MTTRITKMAREAGAWSQQKKNCQVEYVMSGETVKHFAALVAAAEREACAQVCEDGPERQSGDGTFRVDHHSCAEAIRARSAK